tara:strand:+ start:117 stop:677 length:561 start_codon:yes stop_codon:yes gene_type:complete
MRYNIVFVGSVSGGKTSIIKKRLGQNTTKHVSTIAVDFVPMDLDESKVSVWDTCGQERFMSITSSYFMRGHVFVLVHDVSDSTVSNDLEKWRRDIVSKAPARHSPVIIVVSNKADIQPFCSTAVTEWVSRHVFDHVYTSAETGEGIDKLFAQIKSAILVHQTDWCAPSLPALPAQSEMVASPGCAC